MFPRLTGMVHLGALPGAPGFRDNFDSVVEAAVKDAGMLESAGFDGLMIENYGDVPFFADRVPAITVAAMTAAVRAISDAVDIPFGVNVLRNDGESALAIAAVTGAAFIRVNVLSGAMQTDQGLITGRAADLARQRRALGLEVGIFADVFVKHAVPPPGLTIAQAAIDTWERGLADALIVSGAGTGEEPDVGDLHRVRVAVPDAHLLIGSGARVENVAGLLEVANGVIAGTALKRDHVTTAPVDAEQARLFIEAAS
jgi:membrane complex biogenesis BtpA family protein